MTLTLLFVLFAGAGAVPGLLPAARRPDPCRPGRWPRLLFAVAIILSLTAAASRRTVFLDVAIGLALVGFVATLAWARLIQRQAAGERETPS